MNPDDSNTSTTQQPKRLLPKLSEVFEGALGLMKFLGIKLPNLHRYSRTGRVIRAEKKALRKAEVIDMAYGAQRRFEEHARGVAGGYAAKAAKINGPRPGRNTLSGIPMEWREQPTPEATA